MEQAQELWFVEWKKSNAALLNHSYRDAIHFAESSLSKVLRYQVLSLLDICFTAYEKQGLLSQALDEAIRMIQYVPDSPTGYLRAGSVHMASGKPILAANLCRRGLEELPDCSALSLKLERALIKARTRFDIIGNLPLELVNKIVRNMSPEYAWVCLLVSRTWRERVSMCDIRWSSVIVSQKPATTDRDVYDAVPFVSHSVESLDIDNPLDCTLSIGYGKYLKNGIFTKLASLSLKGSFFDYMSFDDFAVALWEVRYTLTKLKVDFGSSQSDPLSHVLSWCPNITDLSYTTGGNLCYDDSHRKACKKLVNLEVFYGNTTYTTLYSNLALCPNLIRLNIKSTSKHPLNYVTGCPISRYCQNLKILGLNYYGRTLPHLKELPYTGRGLLFLGIRFDQHFTFEQAAPHIESNTLTLNQLDIIFSQQPQSTDECSLRLNRQYPKLQKLRYRCDQLEHFQELLPLARPVTKLCMEGLISGILYNSPKLHDVALLYIFSIDDNSTLTALETGVIRTLELRSVYFYDITEDRYRYFLSSLQVQSLHLWNCPFMDDETLLSVTAAPNLQRLKLTGCEYSTAGLVAFFKQIAMQENHPLKELYLSSLVPEINQSVIRYISKINGLKTLRIARCEIDVDSVDYLVDMAPLTSLKTIEVVQCFRSRMADMWSNTVSRAEKHGIRLLIN